MHSAKIAFLTWARPPGELKIARHVTSPHVIDSPSHGLPIDTWHDGIASLLPWVASWGWGVKKFKVFGGARLSAFGWRWRKRWKWLATPHIASRTSHFYWARRKNGGRRLISGGLYYWPLGAESKSRCGATLRFRFRVAMWSEGKNRVPYCMEHEPSDQSDEKKREAQCFNVDFHRKTLWNAVFMFSWYGHVWDEAKNNKGNASDMKLCVLRVRIIKTQFTREIYRFGDV